MDGNPKQLIVERIKNATNILVTVGRNPSVDALSAALGFTMMLNKMDKHATAVVSGEIPDAISFLEPNKTFENTVDSLRDFIIALDKEKADRLRYKVEDDVVRIFITPYRTTITQDDLDFSQGDFNVELIVALGVDKKDDLDTAITAHGRILHDATVVTINAKNGDSSLGTLNWNDAGASSLCEMLMSLSEALQSGLLDEQIASSLLTGIVAATERFSNPHTTPKVMTMAAQLMAAGANQQLIAAKLEEGHALAPQQTVQSDGTVKLEEGSSTKVQEHASDEEAKPAAANGEMQIEHDAPVESAASPSDAIVQGTQEAELAASIAPAAPTLSVSDLQKDLEEATQEVEAAAESPAPAVSTEEATVDDVKGSDWRNKVIDPPSLGGTLSATASEAEEDKLAEERSARNHTILSHDAPMTDDQATDNIMAGDNEPHIDPFTPQFEETPLSQQREKVIQPPSATIEPAIEPPVFTPPAPLAEPEQPHVPTIAELEEAAHQQAAPVDDATSSLDNARAAVDAALGATPTLPPLETATTPSFTTSDIAPPPPPPMPDFSSLPPLPPLPGEPQAPMAPPTNPQFPQQPTDSGATNPGQFKIPGQ